MTQRKKEIAKEREALKLREQGVARRGVEDGGAISASRRVVSPQLSVHLTMTWVVFSIWGQSRCSAQATLAQKERDARGRVEREERKLVQKDFTLKRRLADG